MSKTALAPREPVSHIELGFLVNRAQSGDQAAFEQLYRLHVNRIYALCLRMLADSSRAEEATQDIFIKTWRKIGSFRGESSFSSWLYRLAVNTVLIDIRAQKRRMTRVMPTDDLAPFDRGKEEAPEAAMDLEKAIAALPAQARLVFVLHDVEGWDHEEIGSALNIASGTCRAQLHRARKLLREALGR